MLNFSIPRNQGAATPETRHIPGPERDSAIYKSRLHLVAYAEGHSLSDLLEETLNQAEMLTDSVIGFYHFVEEDQTSLTLQNWSTGTKADYCKADGKGLHYSISHAGVWVDCVHLQKPVVHNDYASLPHRKGLPPGHAQIIRELVVPVIRDRKIKAVLGIGNKPSNYTEEDVETISFLADLAWDIAERKLVEEVKTRLYRELNAIRTCNRTLFRAANEETLLHDICRIICDEAGYRFAWIGYIKDASETLEPMAWAGVETGHIIFNSTMSGFDPRAAATGKNICIQDLLSLTPQTPWQLNALQCGCRSAIALPLKYQDDSPFGALIIFSAEPEAFTQQEIKLLVELSEDLAFGIHVLRKRTEASLHSETRYRRLLESITSYVYTVTYRNGEAGTTFHGPGCLAVTGFTPEEYTGDPYLWYRMVHPDDRPLVIDMSKRILSEPLPQSFEHRIRHKDGTIRWIQNTLVPHRSDKGDLLSYDGIVVDITERQNLSKQLQQAQKMEAIGVLAGGIAHDFNNILATMFGYAELARASLAAGGNVQAQLEEILKAGYRARDLVKQILWFSRRVEVHRHPVPLPPLLKECLKFLRASVPTTIDIRSLIPPMRGTVMADPTEIHQILMNLCTNAAHAMSERGGVLEVSLKEMDLKQEDVLQWGGARPGKYVELTISDTGCGIPQNVIDRIFEPFFTTKERGEGTGLGLSIVQGIVTKMGGMILVESTPGKGTAFRILLPLCEEKPMTAPLVQVVPESGKGKILFVDDEEGIIASYQGVLESFGYDVVATTNPLQAVKFFETEGKTFDLVITDFTMPCMTGVELSKQLLAIRPDIPIILCTGYSAGCSQEMIRSAGIRELLIKPLNFGELATTVKKALIKSP